MNRLPYPNFFDDHDALVALANNRRAGSYPRLIGYVECIRAGYSQYVAASGNATKIADVPLPDHIAILLRNHYASPTNDIAYIRAIRDSGGINTCPMCGSMHSGTLDHIMPRTSYPAFAIFGLNLVPACKCNTLRSTSLIGPNADERILHPYFDDVLSKRILSARFDDVGPVPRISVRLILDVADPDFTGAHFHFVNVVLRTQVRDYLRRLWTSLIERPSRCIPDLRHNPTDRDDLVAVLLRELERLDDFHASKNNWNSIFVAGLLDDHVVDWLFEALGRPGRLPDGGLFI